jgi:hypothetical protein
LRLRSLEEAFAIKNYLDPKYSSAQLAELSERGLTPRVKHELITQYDRSYGIQKIFDLHMKKEYKCETLF